MSDARAGTYLPVVVGAYHNDVDVGDSAPPPAARHIFAHERRRSWGAIPGTPAAAAYPWSNCQTTFSDLLHRPILG
jgi:hypothetical protein